MRHHALVFTVAALALPATAVADPRRFLNIGLDSVYRFGALPTLGAGLQVSYHQQLSDGLSGPGVGAVVHAQLGAHVDGREGRGYFAVAAQASYAFAGLELGLGAQTPLATSPASVGLHIEPYLSLGFVRATLPVYVPLGVDERPTVGVAVGFTLPITLNGRSWHDWFTFRLPGGRPLVVDGAPRAVDWDFVAPCEESAAWATQAGDEYASVAAFARVSLALMALGAPAALVASVHRAALDEVDHARRCLSLAGAPDDVAPAPFAAACAPLDAPSLARVACESFWHGVVDEGRAAASLARRRDRADDAWVRAQLDVLARDEARHAELAWEVLAWCVAAGGEPVARALACSLVDREAPDEARAGVWSIVASWVVREGAAVRAPRGHVARGWNRPAPRC